VEAHDKGASIELSNGLANSSHSISPSMENRMHRPLGRGDVARDVMRKQLFTHGSSGHASKSQWRLELRIDLSLWRNEFMNDRHPFRMNLFRLRPSSLRHAVHMRSTRSCFFESRGDGIPSPTKDRLGTPCASTIRCVNSSNIRIAPSTKWPTPPNTSSGVVLTSPP